MAESIAYRKIANAIGKAGEQRIKKALENLGCSDVQINDDPNGHPDCTFIYREKQFAAECKSMIPFLDKHVNCTHLRRTEVVAMQRKIAENYIPCLIVDVRPRSKNISLQYLVEWDLVLEEYNRTSPEIKSLSFYWILENGCRLDHAFLLRNL